MLAVTAGSIASELLVIAEILVVLYVILKLGKVLVGIVLNSILGLIAIYLVNVIFGAGITYDLLTWVVVAVFGLPAVAIIILLKLIGVSV